MAMTSRECFDAGSDCFKAQRSTIKSFEMVATDLMVISAHTKESINYIQSISVMRDAMGLIKLKGRCSCKQAKNCEHVVSSALAFMVDQSFISQKSRPAKSEATRWIEKLVRSQEPQSERKSILVYRLSPTQELGKMQLIFYRARLLKQGGYGKQNRIEYHQLIDNYAQRGFLSEEDRNILDLFGALKSDVARVAIIEGELGGLLLKKMVATGNAYWHGNRNHALSWGEPLQTTLMWSERDTTACLQLQLSKGIEVIATNPVHYVDTKSHIIGLLAIDNVTAKALPLILQAPSVSKEELNTFALNAISTLPTLPLPSSIEVREITGAPKPRVRLFSQEIDGTKQHLLELSFVYEDELVYASDKGATLVRQEGEGFCKIMRDLNAEEMAQHYLQTVGFVPIASMDERLFAPQDDAISVWKTLVTQGLETLRKSGFEVIVQQNFMMKFSAIDEIDISVESSENWFDIGMHITVEDQRINLLSMVSELLSQVSDLSNIPDTFSFEVAPQHYVTLSSELFQPVMKTVLALYKGERVEWLNINQYELHLLPKTGQLKHWSGSASKRAMSLKKELETFSGIEEVSVDATLKATLRAYQQEGVNWLGFLKRFDFGGILADDMGLGKTLQTLAFLQHHKAQQKQHRPTLIVAPTSLLSNWKNETKKFTPNLSILIHHGLKRIKDVQHLLKYDLVITTYALLSRDSALLSQIDFEFLILDEAQNIKNHRAKVHAAAKKIVARNAIALSGTPMENHLGELWAIFDVVMPGLLGSYAHFKQAFQNPIENEQDTKVMQMLQERIKPFVLRRTKDQVATELPPKTIMTRSINFDSAQAKLYEGIRISMQQKVRDVIKEKGLAQSHITVLDALLKLRQVCCDPRLVPLKEAQSVSSSAKLELLLELVSELLEEGRRILIFSQFTSMLSIIEAQLSALEITHTKLTGSSTNREAIIERFKRGEADVFLISLKAGGVGLNLTEADVVIHYDPWWNPAAEDQATDRAYRIGQDKPVFVYKLIIENSVEEKILALQEKKRALSDAIYTKEASNISKLDAQTLLELFE